MPDTFNLIATSTFGLESVLSGELKALGFENLKTSNGKVEFPGTLEDIARCNLWLRTADRVLIKIDEFKALSFDELFDQVHAINWKDWLPSNAKIHINGRSLKSKLFSISDCQSITKKAIIEKLKKSYPIKYFPENGPLFKIEVALNQDIASLLLDTSGPGLHKRGYREIAGSAPLKETMAAGLVILSKWKPHRILADPCCGSGTILIEAALIAQNIAPGINRQFVSESWPWLPEKIWKQARSEAHAQRKYEDFRLLGSDINGKVLSQARTNAREAGIEDNIAFQRQAMREFRSKKKYGALICNPPYGERVTQEESKINLDIKHLLKSMDTWSYFILTAAEGFEKQVGKRANKRRKLYNGNIKCQYYQYFGPLPPRKSNDHSTQEKPTD